MKEKQPPIVEVRWKDSWTNATGKWTAEDFHQEPNFILTNAGYLIHQDERGINLASQYREEEKESRHVQHIPAGMILKVRKLK